jgi:hypothetical protein
MRNSDIFNAYLKIAEEQGLVSKEETQPEKPKESAKMRRYKKSPAARAGSDTIETIEALYGVKPTSTVEYEKNIMEAAHKKPVVIAPAYDRINALVENNIERNNIMCNIVMRQNTGDGHSFRAYAANELLMSLVRVANDMDNMGQDELRVLADECIEKLSVKKKINKVAILPAFLGFFLTGPGLAVGAALLAGIWLWGHATDPDKGLKNNIARALKELDDLKTNSWYESDVDGTVQRDVEIIEQHLQTLEKYVDALQNVMDKVYKPTTLTEKAELAKFQVAAEENKNAASVVQVFVKAVDEITPMLTTAINNFTSKTYQASHTQESWLGGITSWLGEALHGRWGLVANDFISAANALIPLKSSLLEMSQKVGSFSEVEARYQGELTDGVKNAFYTQPGEGGEKPGIGTPEKSQEASAPMDKDYTELMDYLGHKPSAAEVEFFKSLKE